MYEALFEGVCDADEVSALVDAVGSGLRPGSHGQEAEQVAVVVERVGRPGAAFIVPSCKEKRSTVHIRESKAALARWQCCDQCGVEPGPDVGGWGGGPCPLAVERKETIR